MEWSDIVKKQWIPFLTGDDSKKNNEQSTPSNINTTTFTSNNKNRFFEKVPGTEYGIIPKRATKYSSCYDVYSPIDFTIKAGENKIIKTGIRAYMGNDEVLKMYIRSSIGIKQGVILSNGTGVIDSDYYNNQENGGEIIIPIKNSSNRDYCCNKGDRIAQCMFQKYLITDKDNVEDKRIGGVGSSGK